MTKVPKLTLERTYEALPEEVWELWTTKDGIESWMGPDGFSVAVSRLELSPGGALVYAMRAVGPDQIEYMTQAGMPLVTEQRVTFLEIDPPRRLVYRDLADFIPGVEPYEVETVVELHPVEGGTRMVLTFDAMHDERWTQLATMGRESEMRKLAAVLAARE